MSLITLGVITLDPDAMRLERSGQPIALTDKEFKIFELLARHAGTPVTKSDLSRHALGRALTPFDRAVDAHIASIKKKIGPREDGKAMIKTIIGAGYLLQP